MGYLYYCREVVLTCMLQPAGFGSNICLWLNTLIFIIRLIFLIFNSFSLSNFKYMNIYYKTHFFYKIYYKTHIKNSREFT